MSVTLLHDDTRKVSALLHSRRVRIDPAYGGELTMLFEDERARRAYYGHKGMLVDEAGEAMWDAGLLAERPSPAEVLDLFTLMMQPGADVRTARVSGVDWESAEAKRETRRRNRWRLFECFCAKPKKVRFAGDVLPVRCEECGEMFELRTVVLDVRSAAMGVEGCPF